MACPPQPVELDPTWPHKETPTEKILPDQTSEPRPCKPFQPGEVAFSSSFGPNLPVLFWGFLGANASSATTQATVPAGWSLFPATVTAGANGRFAFILNRQQQPPRSTDRIQIHHPTRGCLYATPSFGTPHPDLKGLKPIPPSYCKATERLTLLVQTRGKIRAPLQVFPSAPQLVQILQILQPNQIGRPEVQIDIQCLAPGQVYLLVGASLVQPLALTVTIDSR